MAQRRRKNKKNKKLLSVVLFLILFVAALAVSYFVWDAYFKDEPKEEENSGVVEEKAEEQTESKEDVVLEEILESDKEPVVQYDGVSPNKADELTGVVTYAAVNGNNLMIRVNIDQYLEGGSCELNLVQGDIKYSSSVKINSVTTATCEGFDVPVNELGPGNYQIIIKLSSGGKAGTIRGEVNI